MRNASSAALSVSHAAPLFESLEKRELLTAIVNAAKIKTRNVSANGVSTNQSVLTVPSTSLVPGDEGWAVYLVEKGRAVLRMVTLGQHGARSVEVVRGLERGDILIRHPDERIREGTRVAER